MACYHPIPAWRTASGEVVLNREPQDCRTQLRLPCGSCIGCRTADARAWTLRCHLELLDHQAAVFTTLTYADAPEHLWKPDLQGFLKRLRRALEPTRIRFFASGEYGERRGRPHYHAILFGISENHGKTIEQAWGKGHCQTVAVTPQSIAYVAGYTQKKIGWRLTRTVDEETGELLYEPPFRLMSRRPGIGANARRWAQSWKRFAVHNGIRIPVPRYLHQAWEAQASPNEKEELEFARFKEIALRETLSTEQIQQRLAAGEQIAAAKQALKGEKRKLD